jgi:hypothetical protein
MQPLSIALAAALLTGCAANTHQQVSWTDDPSVACFKQLEADARFAPLLPKIGSTTHAEAATIQMMTNASKPNDEEKRLISLWAAQRQTCTEAGRDFRARNMPAYVSQAFDAGLQKSLILQAQLYGGEISFGEYTRKRKELSIALKADFAAQQRESNAARQQAQANQAASAANTMLMMQMLKPQPVPFTPMPQSTICNTNRYGNQYQTTCN